MSKKKTLKFCVETGSRDLWNADERKILRKSGVEEIFIGYNFMAESYSRERVKELRNVLENDGLYVKSSHPKFGSYNQPFSTLRQSSLGLREELSWMKEYIYRCGLLGVPSIPLHTGGAMLPTSNEWEIECARAYINELLPIAEEANVIIAVENTNHAQAINFYPHMEEETSLNTEIWGFDETQKIINFVHDFDSDYVKICYDTGHSHLLGKMLYDLNAFKEDIVLFHIHDNDGIGDDAHIQPGYGNSDWKSFFDIVKKFDKETVIYVEAPAFWGDITLMMKELNAIADGKVIPKEGNFLKKDENSGKIIILP